MFIVADNKSMALKWAAGLCLMRDLKLPPGVGWPKKFGPPPVQLFKTSDNGELEAMESEKARRLEGYFNSLVVEKGEFTRKGILFL